VTRPRAVMERVHSLCALVLCGKASLLWVSSVGEYLAAQAISAFRSRPDLSGQIGGRSGGFRRTGATNGSGVVGTSGNDRNDHRRPELRWAGWVKTSAGRYIDVWIVANAPADRYISAVPRSSFPLPSSLRAEPLLLPALLP
jgi:hypothetical protein